MLAAFLLLVACAARAAGSNAPDDLVFLSKALSAGPAARATMWQTTLSIKDAHHRALREAILESTPGQGYNPEAASRSLRALLAAESDPGSAAIERLQLSQIDSGLRCQAEAHELRQRMARLVEIEQQTDSSRRDETLRVTTKR